MNTGGKLKCSFVNLKWIQNNPGQKHKEAKIYKSSRNPHCQSRHNYKWEPDKEQTKTEGLNEIIRIERRHLGTPVNRIWPERQGMQTEQNTCEKRDYQNKIGSNEHWDED